MNKELEVGYGGARLAVEIDRTHARLRINGLVRDAARLGADQLRLSSTVQTGYEWHEHIEAVVEFHPDTVSVTLLANRSELARESYSREASETGS